jgi:hypothetical protein
MTSLIHDAMTASTLAAVSPLGLVVTAPALPHIRRRTRADRQRSDTQKVRPASKLASRVRELGDASS